MSYDVYSGEFLAGHGVPILIVTSPIVTSNNRTTECHAFFSGNKDSYALYTGVYDSKDEGLIDNTEIMKAVKQDGEDYIYSYLAKENSIQYQAMLAGYGYKITAADNKILLHLHLRNFLSRDLEKQISNNTKDADLKNHLGTYANLGRFTSTKKI